MQNGGMRETETVYVASDPKALVGQFRRFGEFGPAYEVLRIVDAKTAFIHVYTNGEELNYSIAEILTDPITETIP